MSRLLLQFANSQTQTLVACRFGRFSRFKVKILGPRFGPMIQSATATLDLHATGPGTYTAAATLTLAVAGSMVEITPAAITISAGGATVKIDAVYPLFVTMRTAPLPSLLTKDLSRRSSSTEMLSSVLCFGDFS